MDDETELEATDFPATWNHLDPIGDEPTGNTGDRAVQQWIARKLYHLHDCAEMLEGAEVIDILIHRLDQCAGAPEDEQTPPPPSAQLLVRAIAVLTDPRFWWLR